MFSKRGTERLTGIMLALSVIFMLAHIVGDAALGHGRTSVVLFLLYGFPVGLAGSALYITFRQHDPTLAMFSGFCFSAHGLLVVLTATILLVGLRFPEEFAFFGADGGSLTGIGSSLELTMDKIGKSAFVFLGLDLSLVGVLILMTKALMRWIGWLGSVVGMLGFLISLAGLTDILVGHTAELLMGISIFTSLFFMLTLGLRLVFHEIRESPN